MEPSFLLRGLKEGLRESAFKFEKSINGHACPFP
jgi:hypothetical protein